MAEETNGPLGEAADPAVRGPDRGARKAAIRALLLSRTWEGSPLFSTPSGRLLRTLVGFLQSPDQLLRWRAVEALGSLCSRGGEEEAVRETIRSLFWGMNDESGNLFRMAPEALGAILFAREDLRREYGPLLPLYVTEEPFEEGALWALCLLAGGGWRADAPLVCKLRASLHHRSNRRRGLALRLRRLYGMPVGEAESSPTAFDDYDLATGTFIRACEPPAPAGRAVQARGPSARRTE